METGPHSKMVLIGNYRGSDMAAVSWVFDRLREPSTWYGLSVILVSVGINVDPELWKEITSAGVAVSGLVLVITKEKG